MSITVKPVTPDFVAEISGLDLAQPLKPADRDAIEAAINRYAIVVFHGQKLSDEQQIDFARPFRPDPFVGAAARHTGIKHRLAATEIADISNLDGDGNVLDANSKRRLDWLANRLWHTDASFRAVPGALSHALCPCRARRGRRHRVRRPARGLRRAAAEDEGRRSTR